MLIRSSLFIRRNYSLFSNRNLHFLLNKKFKKTDFFSFCYNIKSKKRFLCNVMILNSKIDNGSSSLIKIDEYVQNSNQEISEKHFENIAKNLLKELTDDELEKLLNTLRKVKEKYPNFKTCEEIFLLLDKLDLELSLRAKNWDIHKNIKLLNEFCHLNLYMPLKRGFNLKILKHSFRGERIFQLSKNEFITFFYCIGICEMWKSNYINMYTVECYIDKNFENFRINDLCILAPCFIKRSYMIQNKELIELIYKLLCNTISNHDGWKHVLTIIANNSTLQQSNRIWNILELLIEKRDELNFKSYTQALIISSKMFIYHPVFLENVAQKYMNELNSLSIITIEKCIASFLNLNYNLNDECIYKATMQEILKNTRLEEKKTWPKRYIKIIYSLSCANVYNFEVNNEILSAEYLKFVFGKKFSKFSEPKELFKFYLNLLIDYPNYNGNKLENSFVDSILKNNFFKYDSCENFGGSNYSEILNDVKFVLDDLLKPNFSHVCYILPQFSTPNIIFNMSGVGSSCINMDLSSSMPFLVPSKEKGNWFCILLVHRNTFVKNPDGLLIGSSAIRKRYLLKLDYKVIIVIADQWDGMSIQEKRDFLSNELLNKGKIIEMS